MCDYIGDTNPQSTMAYVRRKYRSRRRIPKRRVVRRSRRAYRRAYRRIPRAVTTQANIPRVQHMRYVVPASLSSDGSAVHLQYRANSIFDPEYSLGGHSCMRLDQMKLFYARYVVVGSKISVRYIGQYSNSPSFPACTLTLYLDDDDTPPSDPLVMIENGKCKYKMLTTSVNDQKFSLVHKFSAKKFFNVTNVKDNEQIGALCTANPDNQAYFTLTLKPLDGTSEAAVKVLVTIDYLVVFQEPVDLAISG